MTGPLALTGDPEVFRPLQDRLESSVSWVTDIDITHVDVDVTYFDIDIDVARIDIY